jgi:hypothetical protein
MDKYNEKMANFDHSNRFSKKLKKIERLMKKKEIYLTSPIPSAKKKSGWSLMCERVRRTGSNQK